jgi:hypothetical protein
LFSLDIGWKIDMWRIYRLPGSRDWWLIDHGDGTPIFKVLSVKFRGCNAETVNDGISGKQPRSWIMVQGELHILDNDQKTAIFD